MEPLIKLLCQKCHRTSNDVLAYSAHCSSVRLTFNVLDLSMGTHATVMLHSKGCVQVCKCLCEISFYASAHPYRSDVRKWDTAGGVEAKHAEGVGRAPLTQRYIRVCDVVRLIDRCTAVIPRAEVRVNSCV